MMVGLLLLAGCQSMSSPWRPAQREPVDDPLLSTAEQRRKSRYLSPFPDDELGPRSGSAERAVLAPVWQR
jgi:hypothetical protein